MRTGQNLAFTDILRLTDKNGVGNLARCFLKAFARE
jgi:hypothetical protein